jgi:hypothetical protein
LLFGCDLRKSFGNFEIALGVRLNGRLKIWNIVWALELEQDLACCTQYQQGVKELYDLTDLLVYSDYCQLAHFEKHLEQFFTKCKPSDICAFVTIQNVEQTNTDCLVCVKSLQKSLFGCLVADQLLVGRNRV